MKKDSLGRELVLLFTNYSAQMFQDYIYNKIVSSKWENINISPKEAINKLADYIKNAPPTTSDMYVYRGLSLKGANLLGINDKKTILTDISFMSSTFNIEHAFGYVRMRNLNRLGKYNNCCLLRIFVPKGTNCVYEKYEDQILFAPNTKIKIVRRKK